MGGGSKKFSRIGREQILNAYRAGPDAIFSLIDYLQETLLGIIEEHEARIEELEAKLNRDSHNSDKPPSTDGPKRRFTAKNRERSDKKPGGQEGHEGTTLRMVSDPAQVAVHEVSRCGCCGRSLKDVKPRGFVPRQVFDIPRITVEVTEHRAQIKRCPHCGELSRENSPRG